jgi:hypothetical protein
VVKGAVQHINDLVQYVGNSDLKKEIQTSLDAKLQNAESAYANATGNNYNNTCNQMSAFLSNVSAQTGKALTTAEANYMTAAARQIKATVG